MLRSDPYLDFVRSQPCCAPGCSNIADHAATQSDASELMRLRAVEKTALLVASKHGCRREMSAALVKIAPETVYDRKVTFR